jgi:glycosyltransferase involved in cell wall biosynthesis
VGPAAWGGTMTPSHATHPVALVSSLLHFPAMVGYNRYSVSLARELVQHTPRELTWVPLPEGIHPSVREQLPGRVGPPLRRGVVSRRLDWGRADRQLRPALWHVLTDLPAPLFVRGPVIVTCHGLPRWLRHRHMIADGLLAGNLWDYQDIPPRLSTRVAMARDWLKTKLALRRATAIIADSQYVRWELVNKFGIRADKIHLIHLAPDAVFARARHKEEIEAVRVKYRLPPRFVLGVASFSKTKNTEGLLRLAADLARAGLPPAVLVAPAGAIERYTRQAEADGLEPGKTVLLLHNIPDDDLACVYRAAELFVNLAWEESFGLPIVEAMASGTAVIGSNRTAVPEVIGEGGLVVNPANPAEVFAATRAALTDTVFLNDLRGRALRRSADFSWAKAARQTAAVYERVLGSTLR